MNVTHFGGKLAIISPLHVQSSKCADLLEFAIFSFLLVILRFQLNHLVPWEKMVLMVM